MRHLKKKHCAVHNALDDGFFFSLDYRAVHSDNNIHNNFLWFCVCVWVGIVTICDELCVGIVTICDELFYFIFKWVVHCNNL